MEVQPAFDTKSYDRTKEWLESHCNQKINGTKNLNDFLTLDLLLKQHPSYDTWKNKIPYSFHIIRGKANGAIQLMVSFNKLHNNVGPSEKTIKIYTKYRIVSWVTCAKQKIIVDEETGEVTKIGPKAKTPEEQLTGAMRNAIRKQISRYRSENLDIKCQLCAEKGIIVNKCEVDHYPKRFVEIKNEFLAKMNKKGKISPKEFVFVPRKGTVKFRNGTKVDGYYDKKWKMSWQRFHKKQATYRYLCSTCNKKTNQIKF